MQDRDKEILLKRFSDDNLAGSYQQAINNFMEGSKTGHIDKTEYKIFIETFVKRDLTALAHGYLSMLWTFEEYLQKVESIIAWNLMVSGIINGDIKSKEQRRIKR